MGKVSLVCPAPPSLDSVSLLRAGCPIWGSDQAEEALLGQEPGTTDQLGTASPQVSVLGQFSNTCRASVPCL